MFDRGKIRPDSPSKKSQDETQQKHRSRFLEKTALSPSSEPFHDGTSPLLRQDIVEKGLDELKAYLKKKEGLESAEKVLLEAEEKVNRQEEEKCESLEQKLRENKHNIYEVESKIYELYSELNKIIKETKNLIKNVKEHEEDYKKWQADLEAKQKELEDAKYQFEKIGAEIAEQKKNHQDLKDYLPFQARIA